MTGVKRQRESGVLAGDERTHPSRRLKTGYTENDAQLAKIYNDLADDVQQLRLSAATQLVRHTTAVQVEQERRIDTTLNRLIKGVCSSRKSARLGFSIALSEILRVAFATKTKTFDLPAIVDRIIKLTQVQGNVSGQERRDGFLGRRFAFHAVLQSGVFSSPDASADAVRAFLEAVADLSSQRQWLRRECGAMLYDFLSSSDIATLPNTFLQTLVDVWQARTLWRTPEGVAIWLSLTPIDHLKLPKHVWHKRNPFHAQERLVLAKVMQEVPINEDKTQTAGTRQIAPSFAWAAVLKSLVEEHDQQVFVSFWEAVVNNGLFALTSSNERKYLGLQVVGIALADLPAWTYDTVLSAAVVRCIVNHRAAEDRFLFEAAKSTLSQAIATSKAAPSISADLIAPLVQYGRITFDQATKTRTIETLALQADVTALEKLAAVFQDIMQTSEDSNQTRNDADRRMIADLLVSIVRNHKEQEELFVTRSGKPKLMPWIIRILKTLIGASYLRKQSQELHLPEPSEASRTMLQSRIISCLAHFLTFSPVFSLCAVRKVLDLVQSMEVQLPAKIARGEGTITNAMSKIDDPDWALNGSDDSEAKAAQTSLRLLLCMTILQVYNGDDDAVSVLEDVIMAVESGDKSAESNVVLVEIILGYVSKPSTVYKKLAEQVFSSFASSMTAVSLESLFEILDRKESMSGQQELFDEQRGSDEDDEESESGDAMDVEDDSDLEIVNGVVAHAAESDAEEEEDPSSDADTTSEAESDSEKSSSDDINEEEDEDEEAAFDRKLAEALGSAGYNQDSDDDGSDMDDEQMMQLEPHLTKVFKERQKATSTKQDNKDARENIINFKSRVLDLLSIFVKNAYADKAALSVLMPLIVLVRTTSSKMLSEKAFSVLKQYFEACSKNKVTPSTEDAEEVFELLSTVHVEVLNGEAKLHSNACSRSSLFLAKVLITADSSHYPRIAQMYADLQSRWYLDTKAKVQGSMFTEWTSWSITTRKRP